MAGTIQRMTCSCRHGRTLSYYGGANFRLRHRVRVEEASGSRKSGQSRAERPPITFATGCPRGRKHDGPRRPPRVVVPGDERAAAAERCAASLAAALPPVKTASAQRVPRQLGRTRASRPSPGRKVPFAASRRSGRRSRGACQPSPAGERRHRWRSAALPVMVASVSSRRPRREATIAAPAPRTSLLRGGVDDRLPIGASARSRRRGRPRR